MQFPIAHQRTTGITLSAEEEEDVQGENHDLILLVFTQHIHILLRLLLSAECTSNLTGILASLWISSTHHAVSELAWIGVLTVLVRHDGDLHALEVEWIEDFRATVKVTQEQHISKWPHPRSLFELDTVGPVRGLPM